MGRPPSSFLPDEPETPSGFFLRCRCARGSQHHNFVFPNPHSPEVALSTLEQEALRVSDQLVGQMMAAFGGADGFVTEYFQLCQDAKRTRDGRRLRTRLLLALTRLNEAADTLIQQAKAESPFVYWTNEEIEREHDRLSRRTTEFDSDENSSSVT
jgi:hypothetical protein